MYPSDTLKYPPYLTSSHIHLAVHENFHYRTTLEFINLLTPSLRPRINLFQAQHNKDGKFLMTFDGDVYQGEIIIDKLVWAFSKLILIIPGIKDSKTSSDVYRDRAFVSLTTELGQLSSYQQTRLAICQNCSLVVQNPCLVPYNNLART